MPSLPTAGLYSRLEYIHNPFRVYDEERGGGGMSGSQKRKLKLGVRTARCMRIVEKIYPTFPYLLFDFNHWTRSFNNKYPVRSLICDEMGPHVGPILFEADKSEYLQ